MAHLIACYHPDVRDCTVQCTAATDCTSGQMCRQGLCAKPEVTCDGEDAELAPDAPAVTADAREPCAHGCTNGTCIDGVCVIDCSDPWSCPHDVRCPANLPCRVVCGYHACGDKIICGLARRCDVQCLGDYSCADEIQCTTSCDVDCIGTLSCKRRTKCNNACSCDVSCIGVGSCAEASECPEPLCRIGNGCTDVLPGCNTCG
jgi:hypothetical protein